MTTPEPFLEEIEARNLLRDLRTHKAAGSPAASTSTEATPAEESQPAPTRQRVPRVQDLLPLDEVRAFLDTRPVAQPSL